MPKAIQMLEYGDPSVLKLVEVDLKPLQPDEIRFKVLAAAFNHSDLEIRSGNWPVTATQPFPYTPGLEALGDVVEVGSAVREIKIGQRVITMMQKLGGIHGIRPGGYQEFVTVEAEKVAVIPPELNPYEVEALGLAAITAYNGIKRLNLQAGQTVVIHGASGGVGSQAVALANLLQAQVIATTSNPAKRDFLMELGVAPANIVNLRESRLTEKFAPRSLDAVLETVGEKTFSDSVAVLRRGGHLCAVGATSGDKLSFIAWDLLQDLHLTGYSSENLTGADLRSDMAQLCTWLASGQLRPPVYQKIPLAQAAETHSRLEQADFTGRILFIP